MHTVSGTGTVENQYDYDSFGNPTLTIEIYSSSIRYAGEFFDAEVGLYYLRARYYDPYVGRFNSEDTFPGKTDDSLSLNRYTYAYNNPILYYDPTGHIIASDKYLSPDAQAEIIEINGKKKTSRYFSEELIKVDEE